MSVVGLNSHAAFVSVVGELHTSEAEFALWDWQLFGRFGGTVEGKNHPTAARPLNDLNLCDLIGKGTSLIRWEDFDKRIKNGPLVRREIAE